MAKKKPIRKKPEEPILGCQRCPTLDARLDRLLDQQAREREAWAKERSELLTRIQAWSPNPGQAEASPRESQGEKVRESVAGGYSLEELQALGLMPNSDGGVVDVRLNPPMLYESVEACIATRAFLKKQGLPEGAHPAFLTEGGAAEIVSLAMNTTNGTAKED